MMGWNLISLRSLFVREVRRFGKVWKQTVFSPVITTSLYFLVFGVALGSRLKTIDGVPYIEFVIPGLMMLAMISNGFLNSASSLFQSRNNGTIIDILVAPVGTAELMIAYVGASVIRAFIVGGLVWLVALLFTGIRVEHPGWVLVFALTVSVVFAELGLLTAVWAQKYDHLSVVPSFVLTPLTFLGGVFYSIDMLPEPWSTVSRFNPILYMVNGLRYGMLGVSDVAVWQCAAFVGVLVVVLTAVTAWVFETGYNLQS